MIRMIAKWSIKEIYDFGGYGFENIAQRRYRLIKDEAQTIGEFSEEEIEDLKKFLKIYEYPVQQKLTNA